MMSWNYIIPFIISIVLLVLASITDIKYKKIPNIITLTGICIGVIFQITTSIILHSYSFLIISLIAIIALFFIGMTGILGLGDIKLLIALTALNGIMPAIMTAGFGSLYVILISLITRTKEATGELKMGIQTLLFKLPIYRNGRSVPFAPYMLAGYISAMILNCFI